MKKIKLLLVLLLPFLISCTKKNKIEDIFITPKDHYWQLSNTLQYNLGCTEVNIQFDEDGYSHEYKFSIEEGYTLHEGQYDDLEIGPEKWVIKNDSTLVWGRFTYKIEHIDRTVIVLSYFLPDNKKEQGFIRLLKVVGEK